MDRERLCVGDVMLRHFITASPDDSLVDVDQIMRFARLRELPVCRDGILIGMIVRSPLLDASVEERAQPLHRLDGQRASDSMCTVPALTTSSSLWEAAWTLLEHERACLPVVRQTPGGPLLVGLLTQEDMLRAAYLASPSS